MPDSSGLAAAAPFVRGLASTATSQRAAIRVLRDAGYHFSDRAFRSLFNSFRSAAGTSPSLARLADSQLPRHDQTVKIDPKATDRAIVPQSKYSYVFATAVQDIRTGEKRIQYYTLTSSRLLTKGEAKERMASALDERGQGKDYDEQEGALELAEILEREDL